jgi:hypothetical protein
MEGEKSPTFGKTLNTWAQTVGIVVAGIWGIYTFVFKEIVVPRSSPVNISIDLNLRKITEQRTADKRALTPIEIMVTAKNPSTRQISVLPTGWAAYGVVISREDLQDFPTGEVISSKSGQLFLDKYAKSSVRELVDFGRLFPDTSLKPGEVVTRRLVFFVPSNKFDIVDVQTVVPTTTKPEKTDLAWNLTKEQTFTQMLYRIAPDGTRTAIGGTDEIR